jgi:hypothetical protein
VCGVRLHADRLTDLFPEWLHLNRTGTGLDLKDWDPTVTPKNLDVIEVARDHHIDVHPVLNNAEAGAFDPQRVHALLASPANQVRLVRAVLDWLVKEKFQGLNLDFENLGPADYARLPGFIAHLRDALHPAGLQLSVDIEARRSALPLAEIAAEADFVVLMMHWGGQGNHLITLRQRQLARAAVDAGCDVIVGMHPHVLQGIEYMGRLGQPHSTHPAAADEIYFVREEKFLDGRDAFLGDSIIIGKIHLNFMA